MVVLLDPQEDPDDILRANRTREKQFVFDHALDGTSSQVIPLNTLFRWNMLLYYSVDKNWFNEWNHYKSEVPLREIKVKLILIQPSPKIPSDIVWLWLGLHQRWINENSKIQVSNAGVTVFLDGLGEKFFCPFSWLLKSRLGAQHTQVQCNLCNTVYILHCKTCRQLRAQVALGRCA